VLAVAVFLVVLTVLSIAGLAVYMGGETHTHCTFPLSILTQLSLYKITFCLQEMKLVF
jgi:hypothetical protein